jgi:hypothetical protein
MSMEHRCSDTDSRKLKCADKNLYLYDSVHYNYYIDWPSLKPDFCGESSASNLLSHGTALGMIQ